VLAKTSKTVVLETVDDLRPMLDELWRFVDEAGRDRSKIDVSFGTYAGGDPGSDRFNPAAQLEAVAELADLGVNWSGVGVPGDSIEHAVETMQKFGELVIAAQA
jgi:hypothetical protein